MQLSTHRQSGLSMIEVIVAMALFGSILVLGLTMKMRADDEAAGRAKADALASFRDVAQQYFIANRSSIQAAMGGDATAAAQHCLINVPTSGTGGAVTANSAKRTCAFDATHLRAKGLWPAGMTINVTGTDRYVAIARQIMSTDATPVPTGADEMLIVMAPLEGGNVKTSGTVAFSGDVGRAATELAASMAALGGNGGYIPPGRDFGNCKYNATVKQVCGNGWTVSLDDFL